jgi:exosome complex RNA-binding protein Rrp42 (RNase PH superfamily)
MRRRRDGRLASQLRPLAAEFGLLANADGSARFSAGASIAFVSVVPTASRGAAGR